MIEPTKKPWSFLEENFKPNEFHIMGPDENWLLSIQHNGEQLPEKQRANMRLIAAAPELLESLLALAERYEQELGDGYLGGIPELDSAQAAIRKAQGNPV